MIIDSWLMWKIYDLKVVAAILSALIISVASAKCQGNSNKNDSELPDSISAKMIDTLVGNRKFSVEIRNDSLAAWCGTGKMSGKYCTMGCGPDAQFISDPIVVYSSGKILNMTRLVSIGDSLVIVGVGDFKGRIEVFSFKINNDASVTCIPVCNSKLQSLTGEVSIVMFDLDKLCIVIHDMMMPFKPEIYDDVWFRYVSVYSISSDCVRFDYTDRVTERDSIVPSLTLTNDGDEVKFYVAYMHWSQARSGSK